MKQLIAKFPLIVVLGLSAFTPIVASGQIATSGAHAVHHTQQIAGRRCGSPGTIC